jgi:hypothetical protein
MDLVLDGAPLPGPQASAPADDMMARITADRLVQHLGWSDREAGRHHISGVTFEASGFVVMKGPPSAASTTAHMPPSLAAGDRTRAKEIPTAEAAVELRSGEKSPLVPGRVHRAATITLAEPVYSVCELAQSVRRPTGSSPITASVNRPWVCFFAYSADRALETQRLRIAISAAKVSVRHR